MITIDYRDGRSIYQQLVDRIVTLATSGALLPGDQLPSIRQLSSELSINPNTVQRAYIELERAGIVYSVKGRGSFISHDAEALQQIKHQMLFGRIDAAIDHALSSGLSGGEIVDHVQAHIEGKEGRT